MDTGHTQHDSLNKMSCCMEKHLSVYTVQTVDLGEGRHSGEEELGPAFQDSFQVGFKVYDCFNAFNIGISTT